MSLVDRLAGLNQRVNTVSGRHTVPVDGRVAQPALAGHTTDRGATVGPHNDGGQSTPNTANSTPRTRRALGGRLPSGSARVSAGRHQPF